ncbi:MAG: hypothetical protein RIR26_226 [Pseudomonadota bacterium]|jgi:V8-like Glu-specific endopeptidase
MTRGHSSKVILGASLVAAAAALVACGTGNSDRSVRRIDGPNGPLTYVSSFVNPDQIEKIIGENDLTPVLQDGANIPEKYRPLIDAFGKISMGCTATHIGNGLVLTAGHCFEAPEKRVNNKPCDRITVEWGYRQDKAPYLKSKCVTVLAAELNDDRDYAIFKVDVAPTAKIEMDLKTRPKMGSSVTIFGHPQLRPLEWSKTCVLEEGSRGGWGTDEFSHQCDTEPGNSGSTIIDDTTLKIIGIHDGGRAPWNYGTFLLNTPVTEFVKDTTPTNPTPVPSPAPSPNPTPVPNPGQPDTVMKLPNQIFGPFGNNQSTVLTSFGQELGTYISFTLLTDVQEGKDFVVVSHGDRQRAEVSGVGRRNFDRLRLPVQIAFKSDRFIRSNNVILQSIRIFKAGFQNP